MNAVRAWSGGSRGSSQSVIHPSVLSWDARFGRSRGVRSDGDRSGGVGDFSGGEKSGDNDSLHGRESGDFIDWWDPSTDVPTDLRNVWAVALGSAGFAFTVPDQALGTRLADGSWSLALEPPGVGVGVEMVDESFEYY